MFSKLKSILQDYRLLLDNVPALMTSFFIVSTILMNLMAGKIIFNAGNVAITGGFILSFCPFLAMDTIAKRFGARASIMLNVLSALGNIFAVVCLGIVAAIPTEEDYTHFNYVFGSVWFIVVASTVAFVVSGVVNSLLNVAIGKLFKDNTTAIEFYSRSFISTFIGQAVDNFLFIFLTYTVFAPIFWGLDPLPLLTCLGTAVVGGLIELALEIVMGPIGLAIVRSWERNNVGHDYIEAHSNYKI